VTLPELFAISESLLADDHDSIERCLRSAQRFLAKATAPDVFGAAIGRASNRTKLLDAVVELEHVGFIAPVEDVARVSSAAALAGFGTTHWRFPSTILARELGGLVGRDSVSTTVLKACGSAGERPAPIVEVFMPEGVEHALILEWIRRGIGVHVAFVVSSPSVFGNVLDVMRDEGFRLPALMQAGPSRNDAEGLTALYFDGRAGERPLRIEFCHYA
jgi:hypothetical protein